MNKTDNITLLRGESKEKTDEMERKYNIDPDIIPEKTCDTRLYSGDWSVPTPLPAHVRVDIMFAEVDKLAIIARDHIKRMVTRYRHPQFIDEKPWESNSCPDCKNWGTMDCPNSDKCFSLPSHPYFTPKTEKKCN